MQELRSHNESYTNAEPDDSLFVGGRMVKLKHVPYNELYIKIGRNAVVDDDAQFTIETDSISRFTPTYENGIGLPVAIFCRSALYKDIVALLRTRARMIASLPIDINIPLLYIHPDDGIRVIDSSLHTLFLKEMANELNPFQNSSISHRTKFDLEKNNSENINEPFLQQKLEELIDVSEVKTLTKEERARIAGGFGATDNSVAQLLSEALDEDEIDQDKDIDDKLLENGGSKLLQKVVNEGLVAAVRSGDFHTSRQLLVLYTLIASRGTKHKSPSEHNIPSPGWPGDKRSPQSSEIIKSPAIGPSFEYPEVIPVSPLKDSSSVGSNDNTTLSPLFSVIPKPPPPPLDTNRLRSATNSDGLLAVLGAAEVLKSMQNGSARKRVLEAVEAIGEWVEKGEASVTFRLSSWRELRASEKELDIAVEGNSDFTTFIGTKALSNRKIFAEQLSRSISTTDFESLVFLRNIYDIVSHMHSPCLRLELLQYILGLDNRYSVAHIARSVELAATCLNISMNDGIESQ